MKQESPWRSVTWEAGEQMSSVVTEEEKQCLLGC